MESQINSFIKGPKGLQVVSIFGYATNGVPGLEVIGCGSLSKNIKEKIIYITRTRKLKLPTKRFVLCVDVNDLDKKLGVEELKWLEFPILLLFWHLAKILPIQKLDDCICEGWINTNGEIYQKEIPKMLKDTLAIKMNPMQLKSLKLITTLQEDEFWSIDSSMLLEHIENINFKEDYIDKFSATPLNSTIA